MKLITPFDPSTVTSGTIDTQGINPNEQLMLYNDSIYGLQLTFQDGSVEVIPAGWNKDFIKPNISMGKVSWKIYNQLDASGYPMSQVYGVLYEEGEHAASVNASMQRGFTLTGGTAIVTSATGILNNGNAIGTEIIGASPLGASGDTVFFDNIGNATIKQFYNNALKQIFATHVNASGPNGEIISFGDNGPLGGDMYALVYGTLETTGNVIVDGILYVDSGTASILLGNNHNINANDNTGVSNIILFVSTANNVVIRALASIVGSQIELQDGTGTTQLAISNASPQVNVINTLRVGGQLNLPTKQIYDGTNNNLIDWTSSGVYVKTNPSNNGSFKYQDPNGTTRWSMTSMDANISTCSGGTTISHGLGVTCSGMSGTPVVAQPGSATVGMANFNSTTFRATIGAGSQIIWVAIAK